MYNNVLYDLLYSYDVYKEGLVQLKSGEMSDHYYDFNSINHSNAIINLMRNVSSQCKYFDFDTIFTSAYKSIIMATGFVHSCYMQQYSRNISIGYFRKETKDHGDKNDILGHVPNHRNSVLLFDDVLTSGMSLMEMKKRLKPLNCKIIGALVIVNRMEDVVKYQKLVTDFELPIQHLVQHSEFKEYRRKRNEK